MFYPEKGISTSTKSAEDPFQCPRMAGFQVSTEARALEHYDAYLIAAKREDKAYRDLAEGLKRKPPEPEVGFVPPAKRKKA